MCRELVDHWIAFLTSSDSYSHFWEIMQLSEDIYPGVLDYTTTLECKYVLDMLSRNRKNPLVVAFKEAEAQEEEDSDS
jgi:hypothetical protein